MDTFPEHCFPSIHNMKDIIKAIGEKMVTRRKGTWLHGMNTLVEETKNKNKNK